MSLYNNFASKAELVLAYLQTRHEAWLGLYRRRLETAEGPRDGVRAVFDTYAEHAREHGFRGCGLLNAAAELPAGDQGRAAVRRNKEEVEALLAGHLEALLPGRPAVRPRHARGRSTWRSSSRVPWHAPVSRAMTRGCGVHASWRRTCWTSCSGPHARGA